MTYPELTQSPPGFWRNHQSLLGEILFVLVVAVWGVTFVFTKEALTVAGPFAYNTLRMTLGSLTLLMFFGRDWQQLNRAYFWPVLVTGFIIFASYASQAYGQQFTTASKAGFLTGTNIVYVPLLSALLLRRSPHFSALLGVGLAFMGLYILSVDPAQFSLAWGDFWVALSGIGWALYFIALAYYSPRLEPTLFAAFHILTAALLSGLCWLWLEPLSLAYTSPALWVGVFTTGFIILGLGTSLQTRISRVVPPTRLALIAALEPVFAAVAGWWIGEPLTLRLISGGVLIVLGMLTAEMGQFLRFSGLGYKKVDSYGK